MDSTCQSFPTRIRRLPYTIRDGFLKFFTIMLNFLKMVFCCGKQKEIALHDSSCDVDDGTLFQYKNGKRIHFSPGDLVQPLRPIESMMGYAGICGSMNTVQAIWLKSKRPIEESMVRGALWTLSRQMPHLQLCFSRRGCRLWFRRMKKFSIDFETRTDDVLQVHQELIHTKYNLWTGPLWKVRMIANCQKSDTESSKSTVLMFSVQHSIIDGISCMKMFRELVEILNQLHSTGKEVTPNSVTLEPRINETIKDMSHLWFLTKYACKKFINILIKNQFRKTLLQEILSGTETTPTTTKLLYDELTEAETDALIKICKEAKISVHSCITTAINYALLKVAQSKASRPIENCSIDVIHSVNVRKYLPDEYHDTSGCYISFIEDKSKISLNESGDFWIEAKNTHDRIKEYLEVKNEPLRIQPILHFQIMLPRINEFLAKRGHEIGIDCHYVTTNMGNIEKMLPGAKEGEDIEITQIFRSISTSLAGQPLLVAFQTFRKKFMFSINYSTTFMTDEVGQEFFHTLRKFIRNIPMRGELH